MQQASAARPSLRPATPSSAIRLESDWVWTLTPFVLAMRGRYPRFVGLEYAPAAAAEKALWPVPAVDITRSPFPDVAFDFVLTNEVLESIPDLMAGLQNTARILAPSGQLIGTFPFHDQAETRAIHARLTPAGIEHLCPPEYHGNPVDPAGGSLVPPGPELGHPGDVRGGRLRLRAADLHRLHPARHHRPRPAWRAGPGGDALRPAFSTPPRDRPGA